MRCGNNHDSGDKNEKTQSVVFCSPALTLSVPRSMPSTFNHFHMPIEIKAFGKYCVYNNRYWILAVRLPFNVLLFYVMASRVESSRAMLPCQCKVRLCWAIFISSLLLSTLFCSIFFRFVGSICFISFIIHHHLNCGGTYDGVFSTK